ncbi:formin-binding protein 4-like [Camellia sinensis]|uniref:formin-binding protein 4-like n=1 Tax=Camellia sinensis TaxID=4442 RepID=UPI0010367051|nr:formin-binding protein 4-like [Camellia sinensis]
MAQEESTNTRVNPLGDDDAVGLAEQYRMERREGQGASQVVRARPRTMISATRPISQVEPNHWYTKPNRSVLTVEELEGIRKKYQIPSEIGLRLPESTKRASDVRPGEFSLYEEALRGGIRSAGDLGHLVSGGGARAGGGSPIVGEGMEAEMVFCNNERWGRNSRDMEGAHQISRAQIGQGGGGPSEEGEGMKGGKGSEDPAREELEAQRKAGEEEEEEERRLFARADKYKETQLGPAPKLIARERIRPRPKPLGEKDLGSFEPRPPPVDPVKERANKKGEALKKKKKKRSVPEGAADAPGSKKARVGGEDTPMAKEVGEKEVRVTPETVVVPEVQGDKGQGDQEGETHMSAMPKMQVESGSADPEEVMEQQPKGGLRPKERWSG